MHVGLLEDDIATQEMFLLILQDEGYVAVNYSSAEECLSALGVTEPLTTPLPVDMMIIDWRLDDAMTGIEVIQRLRSTPHLSTLPLILSTAATLGQTQIQELSRLDVALLEKPFSVDEITRLMQRLAAPR